MKIRKVDEVNETEVEAYQSANSLKVDGIVGNQTFGHLIDTNASLKTAVAELESELSMCRQPDDPGAAEKVIKISLIPPAIIWGVITGLVIFLLSGTCS